MADQIPPRRYVVVGAGGIGGRLVEELARMLQARSPGSAVVVVDGDAFEPKNAERQVFTQPGNKAVVRANEVGPLFPDVFVIPDDRWVVESVAKAEQAAANDDESDGDEVKVVTAEDLLREGDIVYAVVDNFACRKLLFDAAEKVDNIDVFAGGNDDALFVSTYHYVRRDGRDITDHPREWHHEDYTNPPDRNPGEMSCQERAEIEGGTQLLATNAAAAALLLGRTQKCIIDGEDDAEAEIYLDLGAGAASPRDRRVENEAALTGVSSDQEESLV